jgi:predicted dehydrogenase
MAVLEGTWTMPQAALPTGPVYCGTEGVLYCTADREIKAMNIYGDEIPLPEYELPAHIANIADHYAYCKRTGTPLIKTVTLEYNLKVMELLDAAMRSAETGTKIML